MQHQEPRADVAQQSERAVLLCRHSASKPSGVSHRDPCQAVLTAGFEVSILDPEPGLQTNNPLEIAQGFDPAIANDTLTARGPPPPLG